MRYLSLRICAKNTQRHYLCKGRSFSWIGCVLIMRGVPNGVSAELIHSARVLLDATVKALRGRMLSAGGHSKCFIVCSNIIHVSITCFLSRSNINTPASSHTHFKLISDTKKMRLTFSSQHFNNMTFAFFFSLPLSTTPANATLGIPREYHRERRPRPPSARPKSEPCLPRIFV